MKLPFTILVFLKVFFFHRYQDRNEEVPFQVFLHTLFQDKIMKGSIFTSKGNSPLITFYQVKYGNVPARSLCTHIQRTLPRTHSADTPTDTNVLLTDGADIAHGQKLFLSARRWDSYQGSSPVVWNVAVDKIVSECWTQGTCGTHLHTRHDCKWQLLLSPSISFGIYGWSKQRRGDYMYPLGNFYYKCVI